MRAYYTQMHTYTHKHTQLCRHAHSAMQVCVQKSLSTCMLLHTRNNGKQIGSQAGLAMEMAIGPAIRGPRQKAKHRWLSLSQHCYVDKLRRPGSSPRAAPLTIIASVSAPICLSVWQRGTILGLNVSVKRKNLCKLLADVKIAKQQGKSLGDVCVIGHLDAIRYHVWQWRTFSRLFHSRSRNAPG